MKRQRITLMALVTVAALGGCEEEGPTAPQAATTLDAPRLATVEGPAQIEGEIGPGAMYGLFLPAEWNGDLVLYAHGYTDPTAPIALPGGGLNALRDALLALGYGVAWSSYSENGYAVKDGVIRTRQLGELFSENFGAPHNTYLMGHSLGGIVALMAAEKNPDLYAGALPMCSLVGGGPMEIDYIFNVRVLFDYFFPGVIPGNALEVPAGLDFATQVVPAVIGAVSSNPLRAIEMAGVDQIELPYTNPDELVASILGALFLAIVGADDLLDRTHDTFVDNSATVYTGSWDDTALNAGVDRFEATEAARNYLERWYLPRGDLRIPVLTVHTTMDPIVPLFHEAAFADIVAAAGKSELLVQRVVDRYGHCAFAPQEQIAALQDLVAWVESGVAPTP
jgi:pimeloyl-ACP methyl ester carboxylesterase